MVKMIVQAHTRIEKGTNPILHDHCYLHHQGRGRYPEFGIYVLADGAAGGLGGTEYAARLVSKWIGEYVARYLTIRGGEVSNPETAREILTEAFFSADSALGSKSEGQIVPSATAVAAVLVLEHQIYTASVGNIRVAEVRDGYLEHLVPVSTWGQDGEPSGLLGLRNGQVVVPEITEYLLEEEPVLLLMYSDGIWESLSESTVLGLARGTDAALIPDRLVAEASPFTADNLSAIAVSIRVDPGEQDWPGPN